MEHRVAELEKRLQQEREKVLLADLRQKEESANAAKVEVAIREVQERLRRDRRDADAEQNRLKHEARIQELESRLISERETWVTTLRGQMQTREVQDKEIESHFASRLQELERRWLEEKGQWQRSLNAKEEEARNLRALAERLKGVEIDLHRTAAEKKTLEERFAALAQDAAAAQAKAKSADEKERDYFMMKAEVLTAKEQNRNLQERLERELQTVRVSAKEREERLLSDNERLQREVQTIAERVRLEAELEVKKHKAEANMASAALQRLRAVAGALERQAAAAKVQAEEGAKAKAELEKVVERYKAEFLVLQKRSQDREKEIRAETAAERDEVWTKQLETEKVQLRALAQQEAQVRHNQLQEELLKAKTEAAGAVERVRAKEAEMAAFAKAMEDFRARASANEEARAEVGKLRGKAVELEARLAEEERYRQSLGAQKKSLEEAEEGRKLLVQEKAALERTIAHLKEEVRAVGEVWRQKAELARKEAEEKVSAMRAELESRKGIFGWFGGGKKK